MFQLTWEVYGHEEVALAFSRFTDATDDFRPVFRDIQRQLESRIVPEQFRSLGGRSGHPWPPLSPRYAAWKERRYPGRPMLVLTGTMLGSLTGQSGGSVRKMSGKTFEFGTSALYGPFHQIGGSKIPRRKFLAVTDDDRIDWGKLVHRHCVGALGRLRG